MKTLTLLPTLAIAIFLSFPIQEGIPPLPHGARLLLFPTFFCFGALVLPYPAILLLAVLTGLLADLACLHITAGRVEIALGWSIVYFVILGSLAHGFEPAYKKGAWWLLLPLSAITTSLYLALQYLMISLRREGFLFNEVVLWRILTPGLLAALLAPFIHLLALVLRATGSRPPRRLRPA